MDLEKLTPTPFEGGTDPQKLTPTTKVLSGLVDQVSELKVQSPVPKEKQCTIPDSTRTRNDLQDQVKGSLSLLGEQISSSMEDDYPISKLIRKGKNLATQEAEESLVPVKQMEIEGEEAKKEKKKKRKKRFGKNWTSMIYTKWGKRGERSRRRYKSLQDVQEPFLVDENVEYSHIVGNRVSKEMVNEEDFTTDLANLEGWRKRRTAFPDSDDEEGTSLGGSGSDQETHLLHQVAKTGVQSERRVEGKDMKAIVIYSEPDVNLADPSHDQLESLTVPNRLQTSDNTSALMIIDSNTPQGLQNIKVLKKKQLRKPVQALAVTAPKSHFGPITADHDHKRRRGVLVGDIWDNRLSCRQWGVHLPPVSGIAGQSEYGAQSVCLSGSYDDEDHGDWFIYSGSGGKELIQSVNRSSPYYTKHQVKDQTFTSFNACLRLSCIEGLPVRVLRSYKFKSSPFAPDPKSLCYRYDGIYRVEKCWRIEKKSVRKSLTKSTQHKECYSGLKVCRFLFLRCDNEPAPWKKSKDNVEKKVDFLNPREYFARLKLEAESILVKELDVSSELTERTAPPAWDWKQCYALFAMQRKN
ncbi:hypothetical protein AXG93_4846s1100 [Marchantia polymorpha subsp. ruderalis]|uniref:YDG domain-containing protein n=1 Tax=Marchantia polymorpha subsp. ruderalis TaxID=1480154 RepID=A0A176VCT4_MARPO|nr:hypothetical protein AXG93_4846s1100 [Marchantia polymorpha subsp. ruderalis]